MLGGTGGRRRRCTQRPRQQSQSSNGLFPNPMHIASVEDINIVHPCACAHCTRSLGEKSKDSAYVRSAAPTLRTNPAHAGARSSRVCRRRSSQDDHGSMPRSQGALDSATQGGHCCWEPGSCQAPFAKLSPKDRARSHVCCRFCKPIHLTRSPRLSEHDRRCLQSASIIRILCEPRLPRTPRLEAEILILLRLTQRLRSARRAVDLHFSLDRPRLFIWRYRRYHPSHS